MEELVCDGALVSTPAGPRPTTTPPTGRSCPSGRTCSRSPPWPPSAPPLARGALPKTAEVRFDVLEPGKRPVMADADGKSVRDVVTVEIRSEPGRAAPAPLRPRPRARGAADPGAVRLRRFARAAPGRSRRGGSAPSRSPGVFQPRRSRIRPSRTPPCAAPPRSRRGSPGRRSWRGLVALPVGDLRHRRPQDLARPRLRQAVHHDRVLEGGHRPDLVAHQRHAFLHDLVGMVPVAAPVEAEEPERQLALQLVRHPDHRAFGHVGVRGQHLLHRPVDSRWPATLMTSSVRAMM
jgi:hypothetical protein